MNNMQSVIINAIKQTMELKGFLVVQNKNWANTGELRFLKDGSFNAKAVISYDFQNSYAILHVTANGKKLYPQPNRPNYFDYYLKYNDMDDLYTQMMDQLFDAL
jgi:hypothetical protein